MEIEGLRDYCTSEEQVRTLEACEAASTYREAAQALGVSKETVSSQMQRIKKRAARGGDHPSIHHKFSPAEVLKGTTSLVRLKSKDDDTPGLVSQYVKTNVSMQNQLDAYRDALDAIGSNFKPLKPVPAPKRVNKDLASLYVITDFHVAQRSWSPECGESWDIKIAERVLVNAIGDMMRGSPDSETGVLVFLGDLAHWDGLAPMTPTAGNIVDADSRFSKMIELCMRLTADATHAMLGKHKKVVVLICEGNHDMASSVGLRKHLKILFENNKRVTVDDTEFPYYAYTHGDHMLAFHHGHKVTNKALPALFASEPRYREMWGKAKYTYIHTGHYHRKEQDEAEFGGAITERHPTLASRDAYATRGGWVSKRAAHAITYDKTEGEVVRVTVYPREK